MEGTKPETRKPIALKDLLLGIEAIHNPNLGIIVKVSCDTRCYLNGHRAWLKLMMPTWVKQLNFYSGGNVMIWHIGKNRSDRYFQINLEIFFNGAIDKHKLHPKIAEMLSGQIRKIMAMQILEKYPPPFDTNEPFFIANTPDLISIKLSNAEDSKIKEFLRAMEDNSGKIAINKVLENHGARFINFFKKSGRNTFMEYGIIIKWNKDLNRKERAEFFYNEIMPFFSEKFSVTSVMQNW